MHTSRLRDIFLRNSLPHYSSVRGWLAIAKRGLLDFSEFMKVPLFLACLLTAPFLSPVGFAAPLTLEEAPLANPGFEEKLHGWKVRQNEPGVQVEESAARSGNFGLRIVDESEAPEDNILITSDPIPVEPFGEYLLTFWARSENGSGVYGVGGAEIAFFDAEGNVLTSIKPALPVFNTQGKWVRHLLGTTAPPAAVTMVIRVTSYTTSKGSIDFDDFEIGKVAEGAAAKP